MTELPMTPLSFTDDQIDLVLRYARRIASDDNRDCYFAKVADALRGQDIGDDAVRAAVDAAFEPFAVRRNLGGCEP